MAKKLEDKDYIKLGKQFQSILDEQHAVLTPAWPKRIKQAVVHGMFSGIGGVIGATVGIAILIFVLYQLRGVPVIGEFFKNTADIIKK